MRPPLLLVGAVLAGLVLPPLVVVIWTSLGGAAGGAPGVEAYLQLVGPGAALGRLLRDSLAFALGSAALACGLGATLAWLAERTDAPGRDLAYAAAFASLAIPGVVKTIGWILLLGPRAGLINAWLVQTLGLEAAPFNAFSLGGMILVEGLLWTPVVFLLLAPALRVVDGQLVEAARVLGAGGWQAARTITLPLLRPAVLAVLLLTLIRAIESFEVPAMLGTPAGVSVFTTEVYLLIRRGPTPRYAEASAYAVVLMLVTSLALAAYLYLTRASDRFATLGGPGYRPAPLHLGRARLVAGLALALPAVLLGLPILALGWVSLLPFVQPPSGEALTSVSLANYSAALGSRGLARAVGNSLIVSPLAATLALSLTLSGSWLVARTRWRGRQALDLLATLPLALPGLVLGMALLRFYAGLALPIYGTIWILIIALTIRGLPYGARITHAAVLGLQPHLVDAARVSGAGPLMVLRTVIFPLLAPALVAAWIYLVMLTVRELSSVVVLASPGAQLVSVELWELWQNGRIGTLSAFSLLLCLVLTPLGLLLARLSRTLDRI